MKALTNQTKDLLRPLGLKPEDRLRLLINDEGTRFRAVVFSVNMFGESSYASNGARSRFVARVPERKRLDDATLDTYELAATDITAGLIDSLWPKEQVIFENAETEQHFNYLLLLVKAQEINAEAVARYAEEKVVPAGFTGKAELPPAGYQKVAASNSLRGPGYGFFMEPGTGKTYTSILSMCEDAKKKESVYRALVVVPRQVRTNWKSEIEQFTTCSTRVTILRGGKIKRIRQLLDAFAKGDEKMTVVVCSYETATIMTDALKSVQWDLMLLDESHLIKAPQTKRSRHMIQLRDYADRRLVLTGTPYGNTPLDLYNQLEFLGKGYSGFMSWKNFKQFYGVYVKTDDGSNRDKLVGLQNMPFLKERIARLSFVIKKEEALPDLPKKVHDVYEVTMGPEQREFYEQVRDTLVAKLENELGQGDSAMVINNILTQLLRLAQITSGFAVFGDEFNDQGDLIKERQTHMFLPNPKLEGLMELLEGKEKNQKTVIWACWVTDIEAIMERLDMQGLKHVSYYGKTSEADREEAVRRFNEDPECRIMVANASCAGAGLNLLGYPPGQPEGYDTNCDHHIVYSQDWSSLKRTQLEDRSNRRGSRVQLRITDLCVPGSIDEDIRARVVLKRMNAMELTDVRKILHNILRGELLDE